jgi:gas vesicle protein
MSKSGSSFFAFLAGLAAGTAIGLLYAPEKGEITRDKLGVRLGKYRILLEEFIADIIERGDEVAVEMAGGENVSSKAKDEGKKVVNEAREKAEKLLEDVENLMSQIKSKA